jgi:hypothetical protein
MEIHSPNAIVGFFVVVAGAPRAAETRGLAITRQSSR